ncbi:MAG: DUF4345 family protein [Pseudomonadota bacterium]
MLRLVLILSGLGFLAFGLMALFDPIGLLTSFGLAVQDVAPMRTELRAFYGGLEIALAAVLLGHLGPPQRERAGVLIALVLYLGLGLGRSFGMIVDGEVTQVHRVAVAIEFGLAALAAAALFATRARP